MAVKVEYTEKTNVYDRLTLKQALKVPGVYLDTEDPEDRLVVLCAGSDAAIGICGNGAIGVIDEDSFTWKGPFTRLPIQSVTFTFEEE